MLGEKLFLSLLPIESSIFSLPYFFLPGFWDIPAYLIFHSFEGRNLKDAFSSPFPEAGRGCRRRRWFVPV